jgi:hypothetical protein
MTEDTLYCFVLVRADQGRTQEILVAHGTTLDALATIIHWLWGAAMDACDGPYVTEHQRVLAEERDAMLAMLAQQRSCIVGRYILPPIAPIWEECTLVITAQDGAFFP